MKVCYNKYCNCRVKGKYRSRYCSGTCCCATPIQKKRMERKKKKQPWRLPPIDTLDVMTAIENAYGDRACDIIVARGIRTAMAETGLKKHELMWYVDSVLQLTLKRMHKIRFSELMRKKKRNVAVVNMEKQTQAQDEWKKNPQRLAPDDNERSQLDEDKLAKLFAKKEG